MMQHLNKWLIFTLLCGFVRPLLDDCCMTIRPALFFPDTLKVIFLTRSLHGKMQHPRERKRFGALACGSQRMAADARLPPAVDRLKASKKRERIFFAGFLGVVKALCPHRPSRSDNSLSSRLQLLLNAAFQENNHAFPRRRAAIARNKRQVAVTHRRPGCSCGAESLYQQIFRHRKSINSLI